jgi:hypothetical protein
VAQGIELQVRVGLDSHDEAAELYEATSLLKQELLSLDVHAVDRPSGDPPPPGARAVEIPEIATLLVTLGGDVIGAVAATIAGWIGRGGSRSVKLEIGGDSIEASGVSEENQARLIEAFLASHAAPAHDPGS